MQQVPPMDDAQFQHWQQMLESRIGITLPAERKSFLLTSLSGRMREIGCTRYQDYLELLNSGRHGAVEWEILVDRLTVHETRFYRDRQALQLLEDHCLARLLPEEEGAEPAPVRLDLWSAGCATGEEAFSLAIAVDHFMQRHGLKGYCSVMATDISRASLAHAREGVYHRNRLKNLPLEILREYFTPWDLDHYRLIKRIRERVCFTRLNLINLDAARIGMMDVIFCQNVLIYFRRERREEIVNRFVEHLRPGGLLILGAGEVVHWRHPDLVPVASDEVIAFRRETEDNLAP